MLDVRTSDKGSIYLYGNVVLMTFVKAKREIKIPAAKVTIYSDDDICKIFLRDAFLFSQNKNWKTLVGRIIEIGGDHAFTYRIGTGFLDTSVKQTEIDMSEMP